MYHPRTVRSIECHQRLADDINRSVDGYGTLFKNVRQVLSLDVFHYDEIAVFGLPERVHSDNIGAVYLCKQSSFGAEPRGESVIIGQG